MGFVDEFDMPRAQLEAGDYWRARGVGTHAVKVQDIALKLGEETGEVQRAVFCLRYPRTHREAPDLGKELVDTLVNLLGIADFQGIDLHEAWVQHWPRIRDSWKEWN
jgi:NTP pyrophosphatase (non-canonical NTP hydrolase)